MTVGGLLACLVAVAVVPQLRWRTWRYEVRDEELDLRHGAWRVVRTLVPVVRIQHVETERTVFSQAFGLADRPRAHGGRLDDDPGAGRGGGGLDPRPDRGAGARPR